jgi:peptide methionine sulfoxide reductase msrA/msrB
MEIELMTFTRTTSLLGLVAVLAAGALLIAWTQDQATKREAAATRKSAAEKNMKPKYSKSGYDLTPLTKEEVAAIAKTLTPEQYRVTMNAGTEPPHCGNLTNTMTKGVYVSVVGGLPLFKSSAKFISKSGWASFFEPFDPEHVIEHEDSAHGMVRVEIRDARSGAHLGHVFDDGPPPTGRRYCLNSAALKFIPEGEPLPEESQPAKLETAYFAAGCFWGVEDKLAKMPGVLDAVSGYMGGTTENPTYRDVCDEGTGHAETVKVVFDPKRVSYRQLLDTFFTLHNPTTLNRQGPDVGTQYRSAVFATTPEQAKLAKELIEKLAASDKYKSKKIVTQVVDPGPVFWAAEEYHQDYHAKHGGSCD